MVRAGRAGAGITKPARINYAEDSGSETSDVDSDDDLVPIARKTQVNGTNNNRGSKKAVPPPPVSKKSVPPAKKRPPPPVYDIDDDSDGEEEGDDDDGSDFEIEPAPKARKPAKKIAKQKVDLKPVARKSLPPGGKSKPGAKKPATPAKASSSRGGGGGSRQSGRTPAKSYADPSDSEVEEYYSPPSKVKKSGGVVHVSIKKKQARVQHPPLSVMVPTAIRKLAENPRKGSSLAAIKSYMVDEWEVNIAKLAPKLKNYLINSVKDKEIIQTKGKGASGRFTIPGLKIKKKKKKSSLTAKWDNDTEPEYKPQTTARDEEREKEAQEKEMRRQQRKEEEARIAEEKAKMPKKPVVRRTEWEVEMVKSMKVVNDKTWYLVKFMNWAKPSWEPEEHLDGCKSAIENFLLEEKVRLAELEERKRRESEEGKYEVGRILEVKFKGSDKKQREFLIRWKGHGEEMDSWEPEENLFCEELIERFMRKHEAIVGASEKRLREAPKPIERLQFSSSKRVTKKNRGFRVTYEGMDD